MYIFQPDSHNSSHPLLSPPCPQVHFLHLCLYSCPANMFISTICLDSIFSSVAQSCPTLWDSLDCSTPGFPVHHLLKLMSITSVMPSNHLILCHHLLLLLSIFPSIRVSSNESVLRIRWPKYWCFSFTISPFNKYLGLISFRMD